MQNTLLTILVGCLLIYALLRFERALRAAQQSADPMGEVKRANELADTYKEVSEAKDKRIRALKGHLTRAQADYNRKCAENRRLAKQLDAYATQRTLLPTED